MAASGEPFSGSGPFARSLISAWLLSHPTRNYVCRRIFSEMSSQLCIHSRLSHPLTPSLPPPTRIFLHDESKNLILRRHCLRVRLCLMQTTNNFITLHIVVWLHNLTPENVCTRQQHTLPLPAVFCLSVIIYSSPWLPACSLI